MQRMVGLPAQSIAAGLPAIARGASSHLEVGDVVLAIVNPFGGGQTVTQGIVSATGRNQLGITTCENFIQADPTINQENSGRALVDFIERIAMSSLRTNFSTPAHRKRRFGAVAATTAAEDKPAASRHRAAPCPRSTTQ